MIRKISIGVILVLAAGCVGLLIVAYPYHFILEKRVYDIGVQNIIQAADNLDQIQNLPDEIKSLNPVDVSITDEGVYIQLDGYFVTAEGIFIQRESSKLNPKDHGDPSYRQIEGRLYWYYVTG